MIFKGEDGLSFPINGSSLILGSIHIVGDDGFGQANEGEVIEEEEANIHEVSCCS